MSTQSHQGSSDTGTCQAPSEYQLLVFLKYVGSKDSSASNKSLPSHFRIHIGTVELFRQSALTAMLSLSSVAYHWPNGDDRRIISDFIKNSWSFPNCVGIMDRTLLHLETRPELYEEKCYTRKGGYSINMLVLCDHRALINYYVVGWPGSVHDNRVRRNSHMKLHPSEYFNHNEYLLSDSSLVPGDHVVPEYKCSPGSSLSSNKSAFNELLSKARVKSEHCIGLLKGRW